MNSEIFVEALRVHVRDAAVNDAIAELKQPSGRRVAEWERARSTWYNGLSADEAAFVDSAIAFTAHLTLFGLLVVLDGARKIHDEEGRLELAHISHKREILNDPQDIGLHGLLNASG